MRDVVRQAFVPLTVSFEGGYITWMFPDVKGLVSTGFGLLLDPVALALALPWKRRDGTLASREEIVADWATVRNFPGAARLGHRAVERIAKLRLDREGLFQAFQGKMNQMEAVLIQGFPGWNEWPADAQLGVMSQAWAIGPAFYLPSAGRNYWPKLTAALRARDFATAAVECFMDEEKENPGIRPRNVANRILFLNADAVVRSQNVLPNLKPDELYYPISVAANAVRDDDDTIPELNAYRAEQDGAIVHPWHFVEPDEPPDDAA